MKFDLEKMNRLLMQSIESINNLKNENQDLKNQIQENRKKAFHNYLNHQFHLIMQDFQKKVIQMMILKMMMKTTILKMMMMKMKDRYLGVKPVGDVAKISPINFYG